MTNESELQMRSTCLDDDCNIVVVDVDGDGVPDYVVIRIRWIIAVVTSLTSIVLSWIM